MSDEPRVTLQTVRDDYETQMCVALADQNLAVLGFTEHGQSHCSAVAETAQTILLELGRPQRLAELAAVAGYMHDIGNMISREQHGVGAALLSRHILDRLGMPLPEIIEVMCAIGNHEEEYGEPVSEVAAAVILGDKSDVRNSRVRETGDVAGDIHDRVNAASRDSRVTVDAPGKTITLALEIDTDAAPVMEYFEIFLSRMVLCRKAASFLGCHFHLVINDVELE
jgi:metal-dependent HD superfamily phosphatase/phosphodiesterase